MAQAMTTEEAKKDLQGVVEEKKVSIQKAKEAQMSEAEKKAFEEKQRKEKETKAQADEQAKKDTELLAKKPEERTSEEAEKVKVLEEENRKKEEAKLSTEQKVQRVKDESQKRIDEISNKLKQLEDDKSKEAEELRKTLQIAQTEIENLSKKTVKPEVKDDIGSFVTQKENERVAKCLEEDKAKPREQRREMPDEEWNEWFLENPAQANRWLSRQEFRRTQERQKDYNQKQAEKLTDEFMSKHTESKRRVEIRHPELDLGESVEKLLKEGKTEKEAFELLAKDNEKLRVFMQVMKDNPKLLFSAENGPELVAAEMEKHIVNKSADNKTEDQKVISDLKKQVEELTISIQEMQNSDEGINSSILKSKENQEKLNGMEQTLVDTMQSKGASEESIQSALKKFRVKQGVKK